MKRINVRFERVRELEDIDVVIRASERDAAVTKLMEQLADQPPDLLTVTDTDGTFLRIVTDDIISVSVRDKLTLLVTEGGSFTVRQSLQSLGDILDPGRFLRISRYELVNIDKIERYDFTVAGTLRLELSGGMETWASRRCIPALRKRLLGRR